MFITLKNSQGTVQEVPPPQNQVMTDQGFVPVTRIRNGMAVRTQAHGLQLVNNVLLADVEVGRDVTAIVIAKDAFGPSLPERDTILSKETRVFLKSPLIYTLTGHSQSMVPAGHLTIFEGVEQLSKRTHAVALHLLTKEPSLIDANGLWVECFRPTSFKTAPIDELTHCELTSIFGALPVEWDTLGKKQR